MTARGREAVAAVYALGEYATGGAVSIRFMAWSHGLVNGLGFVLPGLAAWVLAGKQPQ